MKNIVLIGMPGCGKSTIGRLLAKTSGKTFFDCDQAIEKAAGLSIPEIFEQEGEDGFRIRETQVIGKTGKQSGLVIATGGGCVTREENYHHLKQNGIIIFIERPIHLLVREGRPLSTGNLEEMYKQRLPLYLRFADYTIQNDDTAENAAKQIFYMIKTTTVK